PKQTAPRLSVGVVAEPHRQGLCCELVSFWRLRRVRTTKRSPRNSTPGRKWWASGEQDMPDLGSRESRKISHAVRQRRRSKAPSLRQRLCERPRKRNHGAQRIGARERWRRP